MDASSFAPFNTVRAYGLEGFLTGDCVRPPAMVVDAKDPQVFIENPDFLYWTRMDQFLVSWLIGSIYEAMLGHVIRCTFASEIWSTLHELLTESGFYYLEASTKLLNLFTLGFQLQWALTQTLQDSNLLKALTLNFYKNEFLNFAQ
ncbi:hypothetical protein CK203_072933 [Vitis vinifera]|uniref:Retrotransposon Copia-like N-terminal domain-containing protein n=1 Tax=Vitis vinifera TaxID=29760 RepID=A0A438F1U0_VITVI|nr:hypothetical protein CK203_072933 [Vitis vinifera]